MTVTWETKVLRDEPVQVPLYFVPYIIRDPS